ncbi:extracellular solute-binding protein [Pseudomonadota bacterium]|nr:extracellular solute-binding protein [Pseudomonadota bacterium]
MLKTRRKFLKNSALVAAATTFSQSIALEALAADPLKIWTIGVAKVTKTWDEMGKQAGVPLVYSAKSGSADQAIQKFFVGDGQKLYDAITDNGGGQEDAMSDNNAIVPLDVSKIKNWKNLLPTYNEGNLAANTIRNKKGEIVGVPYISNADSMAYNKSKVGGDISTWDALFDSQFKGYAAMQNDSGPTLTTTAIYLKESGKQDIVNASDMTKSELKGVCQFLIGMKKKGQFRTFWDGFGNGVDLLASEEVLVSSCWEPIAVIAAKKGADIHYGTMKEGHQTWNNVWMLTKGGKQRGQEANFYKLMDMYLSPWFGARTLSGLGFTPQMIGVNDYVNANPDTFDAKAKKTISARLSKKDARMAVTGNSWQNLYPKEMRAYQDWWSKVQAA